MTRPPIHPGEMLADELEELGISATALSRALDVPTNRITQIINGQRAITAETALRLGHWFGTSPDFWLNLQKQYELRLAEQEYGQQIRETVSPRVEDRHRASPYLAERSCAFFRRSLLSATLPQSLSPLGGDGGAMARREAGEGVRGDGAAEPAGVTPASPGQPAVDNRGFRRLLSTRKPDRQCFNPRFIQRILDQMVRVGYFRVDAGR
jgi:addiction module HigA family antidote